MNSKVREHLLEILLVFTLFGCSGIPMPASGYQPMTQSQIVAGVYAVFSGQQPIAWLFNAPGSNLRILFWPGATNGAEQLINMVCIQQCGPGWERIGAGYAMTGQRASDFAAYLKAGGWQQLSPTLVSVAARGQSVSQWLGEMSGVLSGFFIVVPIIPAMLPEGAPQT